MMFYEGQKGFWSKQSVKIWFEGSQLGSHLIKRDYIPANLVSWYIISLCQLSEEFIQWRKILSVAGLKCAHIETLYQASCNLGHNVKELFSECNSCSIPCAQLGWVQVCGHSLYRHTSLVLVLHNIRRSTQTVIWRSIIIDHAGSCICLISTVYRIDCTCAFINSFCGRSSVSSVHWKIKNKKAQVKLLDQLVRRRLLHHVHILVLFHE